MNHQKLLSLFKIMMQNSVPSAEAFSKQAGKVIHFQGSDSKTLIHTEGFEPIELQPNENIGKSFSLVDEGVKAHDDFLDELKSDQTVLRKIGRKSLEKNLELILRTFKFKTDYADAEVLEFIKSEMRRLKDSIQIWTAIAPIDNLILEDLPELKVGNVLMKPTTETYAKVLTELKHRLGNVENYSETESQNVYSEIEKYAFGAFSNTAVCAEVSIEAESNATSALANEEIDSVLNLLRCYINILFPRDHRVNLGLRGEVFLMYRPNIGFAAPKDNSWNFTSNSVGTLQPYILNAEKIQFLSEKYAFDVLSNTLSKSESERSKLEKIIVTAIRWLGRGIVANDLPVKVLHFAAALENLIMGGESTGEITEKFSRRLAFLVENDSLKRKQLYERAKLLYNKRSKIIHSGSIQIDASEVNEMEVLTLKALIKMAYKSNGWSVHRDFVGWYDENSF